MADDLKEAMNEGRKTFMKVVDISTYSLLMLNDDCTDEEVASLKKFTSELRALLESGTDYQICWLIGLFDTYLKHFINASSLEQAIELNNRDIELNTQDRNN